MKFDVTFDVSSRVESLWLKTLENLPMPAKDEILAAIADAKLAVASEHEQVLAAIAALMSTLSDMPVADKAEVLAAVEDLKSSISTIYEPAAPVV